MIRLIKKIFSKPSIESSQKAKPYKDITTYLKREIDKSGFIRKDKIDVALKHLTHEINLNKTGNKLSADEKKNLKINPRLSITHELVSVLNENGLAQDNPKDILSSIYNRATFRNRRDEDFIKWKEIGISRYKLMACGDERDCDWCKSMNGRTFPLSKDINTLIEERCNCDSHCRLIVQADIDLNSI